MINWFEQGRIRLAQWFGTLRLEEGWSRVRTWLSGWLSGLGTKAELNAAPAGNGELALDSDFLNPDLLAVDFLNPDFLNSDFLEADLLNWRSHGQWKDSASRERNYWTASTAPAEILWKMVTDLAGLASWHPLIASTNAPFGQQAKPGLIYRVFNRYFPLSTQVFVERVQPGELLSIRLFPCPGLQERVTYRIVSTLFGTCVLYSITLSGWLSPLAWPMMKPHAVKVAAALVQAAEQETMSPTDSKQRRDRYNQQSDIF